MKTHFFLMSTIAVLGTSLMATSYAASNSEYLHMTRHRDSDGNLLMAAPQHQAESSVMQKAVMPSQPKTFERKSTDWGMAVQEVKENEPVQSTWDLQAPVLADNEQRVAYNTQIEGIEAALTYTFYEDHLSQAKYVFEPQHEDAVEYVQDFQTVKGWITQSYGLPTSEEAIWLDTLYQYDSSLWGQAVQRGHLTMVAEWNNPGTDIVLLLDGGDDTVGLVADFSSTTFVVPVSFDPEIQEANVEAVMEDHTIHKAMPVEESANSMDEELSVQDMPVEGEDSAESMAEAEVASQGPGKEMQDIQEIEHMLNEEIPETKLDEPAMDGGSMESGLENAVREEATSESTPDTQASMNSEVIEHDMLDEHPIDEQHLVGEGKLDHGTAKDGLIEPSVTIQEPEHTMDMSEAMPVKGATEEPAAAVHQVEEHAVDPQASKKTMDMSEETPVKAAIEESSTAVHQAEESAVDHANSQAMEEELDPQHHL